MRSLASIAGALVLLVPHAAAQKPQFRTGVDLVVVDALVTDHGKPVEGLTAEDFDLRDEGVPQQINLATTAGNVNVVLALDTSESLAGENLEHLKAASHALIGALRPGDTASLLSFSRAIGLLASAERNPAVIDRALDSVSAAGRTSLLDALYTSIAVSSSNVARSLVILFSDGAENASWLEQDDVMDSLRHASVVVYTVAAPNELDARGTGMLTQIAEVSGGTVLHAGADRKLGSVFVNILNEFRLRYLLTYTPAGVQPAGWHRISVKLKGKSGRITARPGYFGRSAPR
jgi:VWFA-related protein